MTALNVASLGKAHATILVVASIDELATHLIFFLGSGDEDEDGRKSSPELADDGMTRRVEISIYYTKDFPN